MNRSSVIRKTDVGQKVEKFLDNYETELSPLLWDALEELAEEIDGHVEEMEDKITELENEVGDLDSKVEVLEEKIEGLEDAE